MSDRVTSFPQHIFTGCFTMQRAVGEHYRTSFEWGNEHNFKKVSPTMEGRIMVPKAVDVLSPGTSENIMENEGSR